MRKRPRCYFPNHGHLHLAPPQGVTPVECRGDLWHQKTRVPGVSCGVIRRLAVLVEHRLVTDGQTDGRTDGHRAMASTADASHRAVKNDDDDNGNNDEVNWA